MLEEEGATHIYHYLRGKLELPLCSDIGNGHRKDKSLGFGGIYQVSKCAPEAAQPPENISKELYIEVSPGSYSVSVSSNDLTKKTQVVAVDSGQSVDLVFPT